MTARRTSAPGPLSASRRGGTVALVAMLACCVAGPARAQDSQFGIKGLGTPGRMEGVRVRSTAGAFAPFDPISALADAALSDVGRLTAWTLSSTAYRHLSPGGADATLRTPRFPQMGLSGPIGHGIILGGGFATYLDRSYQLATQDTVLVRGVPQPVTDLLSSDGGVVDLRVAASARAWGRLWLGLGLHLLTGSTRLRAVREFTNTTYSTAAQTEDVNYDGAGISASAIGLLGPTLRVAAFARSDSRLRARLAGAEIARNDLPVTVGGAVAWQPGSATRVAATVVYQSWSDAGQYAHNTTNWAVGAELGNGLPLRLGARSGRLPFSPAGAAPREWGASVGTGLRLAGGRGLIDVGLEHLQRRATGLTERVWTFLLGITVRP